MSYQPNAGAMDQRITLREPSTAEDALGQRIPGWTDVCTVWAQVQPFRGREFLAAHAAQSSASVRFRLRYRAGVTSAMQVVWGGVAHAIVGQPVDVDGGKHTLELMCSAGATL